MKTEKGFVLLILFFTFVSVYALQSVSIGLYVTDAVSYPNAISNTINVVSGPQKVILVLPLTSADGIESVTISYDVPEGIPQADWPKMSLNLSSAVNNTIYDGNWEVAVTVPRYQAAGYIRFSQVVITQKNVTGTPNVTIYTATNISAMSWVTGLFVNTGLDLKAPKLLDFTITPSRWDENHTIFTATGRVIDDFYVQNFYMFFQNPRDPSYEPSCYNYYPTTGDHWDGIWTCTLTIYQWPLKGNWTIHTMVQDSSYNSRNYTSKDHMLRNWPYSVEIQSYEPPAIVDIISPGTVDVRTKPASANYIIITAKNTTSMNGPYIELSGPTDYSYASAGCVYIGDTFRNNQYMPMWNCSCQINQFTENGTWHISYLENYGDFNSETFYSERVLSSGYDRPLTVLSNEDFDPPTLVYDSNYQSVVWNPTTLDSDNLNGIGTNVTLTFRIKDNVSGFASANGYIRVSYVPQVARSLSNTYVVLDSTNRISGNAYDGTYRVVYTATSGDPNGYYRMDYLQMTDLAGNSRYGAALGYFSITPVYECPPPNLYYTGYPLDLVSLPFSTTVFACPSDYNEASIRFKVTGPMALSVYTNSTVSVTVYHENEGYTYLDGSGVVSFSSSGLVEVYFYPDYQETYNFDVRCYNNQCKSSCPNLQCSNDGIPHYGFCNCTCPDLAAGATCQSVAVCPNNCNGKGTCTNSGCRCNTPFAGTDCSQCDVNHWGKNCERKCMNCYNGKCDQFTGQCTCNTGFTGSFCDTCILGNSGTYCNQTVTAINYVAPSYGTRGTRVSVYGKNFDNKMPYACEFNSIPSTATYVSTTLIQCIAPVNFTDGTRVSLYITANTTIFSSQYYFYYRGSCTPASCNNAGVCTEGSCVCNDGYYGETCQYTESAPVAYTGYVYGTEGEVLSQTVSAYGGRNFRFSFSYPDQVPQDMYINEATGEVVWYNPVASSNVLYVFVTVSNRFGSTQTSLNIDITPAHKVTIDNSKETLYADYSTPLSIYGTTYDRNNQQKKLPYKPVRLIIQTDKSKLEVDVTSDALGNYQHLYRALSSQVTFTTITAVIPSNPTQVNAQYSITMIGMQVVPDEVQLIPLVQNQPTAFDSFFSVKNVGPITLTQLTYSVSVDTRLLDVQVVNLPSTLLLNSATNFTVNLNPKSLTSLSKATVTLNCSEGALAVFTFYFSIAQNIPILESRGPFAVDILQSQQTIFEFVIENVGGYPTGPLSVYIPPYFDTVSLLSPTVIPSLDPNESYRILLLLTDGVPTSAQKRAGTTDDELAPLVRVGSESTTVSSNINVKVRASISPVITFNVNDELGPVPSAVVSVTTTNGVVQAVTDNNGLATVQVPSLGAYEYSVTESSHLTLQASQQISLSAASLDVLTPVKATSTVYVASVTPETTGNGGSSVNSITPTTQVAATANQTSSITVSPSLFDLDEIEGNYLVQFSFTIKNTGNVRARNVTVVFPTTHPSLDFISDTTFISELNGLSQIQVPVTVTQKPAAKNAVFLDSYTTSIKWTAIVNQQTIQYSTNVYFSRTGLPSEEGTSTDEINTSYKYTVAQSSTSTCLPSACQQKMLDLLSTYPDFECSYCISNAADQISLDSGSVIAKMVTCTFSCAQNLSPNITANQLLQNTQMIYNLSKTCLDPAMQSTFYAMKQIEKASQRVLNFYSLFNAIFNNNAWLSYIKNSTWASLFLSAISESGDQGGFISDSEAAALAIPPPPSGQNVLTYSVVTQFFARWNLTKANYADGNLTSSDNQFIDFLNTYPLYQQVQQDYTTTNNIGGTDVISYLGQTLYSSLKSAIGEDLSASCYDIQLDFSTKKIVVNRPFTVTLKVKNLAKFDMKNINVNIFISDKYGNQSDASALFTISSPVTSGITGYINGTATIVSSTTAIISWSLTPKTQSVVANDLTVYQIDGTITFSDTVTTLTIPLLTDSITVFPDVDLQVHYFVPSVFPTVSGAGIPTKFAMAVRNFGLNSQLSKLAIESTQQNLVDSTSGLTKVKFQISTTQLVATNSDLKTIINPSFNLELGDLKYGDAVVSSWTLLPASSAKLTQFSASTTHTDVSGFSRPSNLKVIKTHTLMQQVQINGYPAFITDENGDKFSDTIFDPLTFTSSPLVPTVPNVSQGGNNSYNVTVPSSGLVFFNLTAGSSNETLVTVLRSDGTVVPPENYWKAQDGSVYILDDQSNGNYLLTFAGLKAVTNLRITLNGTNRIGITWNEVNGALYYQVYAKSSSGSTFSKVSEVITSTSFVVPNLTPGVTYQIRVYAGNSQGFETQGSTVTGTTAPLSVTCSNTCGSLGTPASSGGSCYCLCSVSCSGLIQDSTDCTCNVCAAVNGSLYNGLSCTDKDSCSAGTTCSNGTCQGGTNICTACQNYQCSAVECNTVACAINSQYAPYCKTTPVADGTACSKGTCSKGVCTNDVSEGKLESPLVALALLLMLVVIVF